MTNGVLDCIAVTDVHFDDVRPELGYLQTGQDDYDEESQPRHRFRLLEERM